MSSSSDSVVVWKHIGLRGHSVGTLTCENDRIVWRSAITGRSDDVAASTTRTLPGSALKQAFWTVLGKSGHLRLQTNGSHNLKHELRLDGFPPQDWDLLQHTFKQKYGLDVQPLSLSSAGTQYGLTSIVGKNLVFQHCVLDEMNEEGQEFEPRATEELMSLDLAEVTQCVLPGNNRNEMELQFPESDTIEAGTDQLVSIRMYIPPDPDADPADKEAPTPAEMLQQRIMQTADIRKTTGDVLVSFDASKGTFLTPRGRYQIDLYDYFLRMRGQKFDYKIKYEDISRLFLLPKPDEVHMAFVIALDKPIRQGQQRYQYLVLQATKENDEVEVNMDEAALQKEYNGELQPVMRGSLANLIAKTFKVIAKKKVFIPGKFTNASQQPCVKCAVRANEGLLYPLEKQFVFIHKPPILVRFNEIDSVEFQRYAGGQGTTRNFDLCVNLKDAVAGARDYTFSGIDRSDYASLYNFLSTKNIAIKNLQEEPGFAREAKKPVYNEDEIYGGPADDDEEGSEDEDYDEAAAAKEQEEESGNSEDDMDDDEMGSEIDDKLDSDLDEARNQGTKRSRKESPKKTKKASDGGTPSKKRAKKDPNAPKRALTAYFMFSNTNRARIKEKNPDAAVSDIAKLLGEEWKGMTAEQKVKYDNMAAEDKKRYAREMKDYVPPAKSSGGQGDKKKKKDPNAPKRSITSYLAFSNEMRPKIKAENPALTFGELGKKIGELFKGLTAEEKVKYENLAKADKQRYNNEMAAYKEQKKSASDNSDSDDDDSDEGAAKPKAATAAAAAASDSDDDDSDDDGVNGSGAGDDDNSDDDSDED